MFVNDCENNQEVGRIVGIDPGTTTMGISVIEYNVVTLEIIRTCAHTVNAGKLRLSEQDVDSHGARYARIFGLQNALYELFLEIKPNFVIAESPFMARRMPTAFAALTEVVFAIRSALRMFDPTMVLDLIDPPSAKLAVGAKTVKGGDTKKPVRLALNKLENVLQFDNTSSAATFDQLDEHSIDGTAIAYARWRRLREE